MLSANANMSGLQNLPRAKHLVDDAPGVAVTLPAVH
jgi:hypothetical protein